MVTMYTYMCMCMYVCTENPCVCVLNQAVITRTIKAELFTMHLNSSSTAGLPEVGARLPEPCDDAKLSMKIHF